MSFAMRGGLPARPDSTVMRLLSTLRANALSDLPMRSAVGWVLAANGGTLARLQYLHVADWTRAGLGQDGWLYSAAGFTLAETLAARDRGSLDLDRARMLAGLRGVALPVG